MKKISVSLVIASIILIGFFVYLYFGQTNSFFDKDLKQETLEQDEGFPNMIGDYSLFREDKESGCQQLNGREVCADTSQLRYQSDNQLRIVHFLTIENPEDVHFAYDTMLQGGDQLPTTIELNGYTLDKPERHEISWIHGNILIMVQEYSSLSGRNQTMFADGNNEVTRWFLETYPPKDNF